MARSSAFHEFNEAYPYLILLNCHYILLTKGKDYVKNLHAATDYMLKEPRKRTHKKESLEIKIKKLSFLASCVFRSLCVLCSRNIFYDSSRRFLHSFRLFPKLKLVYFAIIYISNFH